MADVLEQFTRKPKVEAEREYVAYKADRKQVRMKVRPVEGVWDRLPYRMLLRIMEMGREGTAITLVYSFMAVFIEGRNLGAIADAIEDERCDFIEQFDPMRHDMPGDSGVPFIAKITIHAAADMGTPGKPPAPKRERQPEAA